MRRIAKIINCTFFIVLIASIPFSSTIVFGQQLEAANCGAVRKWEMEQWPTVAYCKTPLEMDGDYRYFVYLNKPDSYTDFKLDVNEMSSFWVEALHQTEDGDDVAYWDSGINKVVVEGNGVFIIHGDGSDLSFTDPSPSDQMVRLYQSESCENLVFQMTTVAEENIFVKIRDVTKDLMFMRAVINSAVASMFEINEGTQLPTDYTAQLTQFMQNSVDESGNFVEPAGLVAVKNGRIQNFWDLEGYRGSEGWSPDEYSLSIIEQVFSDWDNAVYDDVWVVHAHLNEKLTHIYRNNGLDIRLRATPSIDDVQSYNANKEFWFKNHDTKYLILSSPTQDDLAAGKVYMRLSEIDPSVSDVFNNHQFLGELAKLPNPFDETPVYHPLGAELKGGYKSLYVTLSGDQISVSSIPPAGYFGDVIKLSYDQFLDLRTASLMYEGKQIVSQVNTGDIGKDLGEAALNSIVDDLSSLEGELQASNFPRATKDTHSTIIANVRNMLLNEINSGFGEDAWATFIYDFGEVQLDASLQVIDGIDEVSNIGQWGLDNGFSVDSQAQNIADDAVESMVYTIENEWGPYLQQEYTFKVGETIDTIPDELSSPLDVAKTNYWTKIAGISFAFLLTLGPYFEYFGREADNYFLYYLGVGLKAIGTTMVISYAASVGLTIYTLWTIGMGSAIPAFLLSVATSFVISLVTGLFVSFALMVIFTLIFFPPQQLCDADRPWYNQVQLQLDRAHITSGYALRYVYYGTRCGYKCDPDDPGCDPLAWKIDMFKEPSTCPPAECWVGRSYCSSVDGRCFECETYLEYLDPAESYEVVSQSEYPFMGYQTSSHDLTVCPSGYVVDTSPTEQCVLCLGYFEDDVFEGTPNNKFEFACGASLGCDEIGFGEVCRVCEGADDPICDILAICDPCPVTTTTTTTTTTSTTTTPPVPCDKCYEDEWICCSDSDCSKSCWCLQGGSHCTNYGDYNCGSGCKATTTTTTTTTVPPDCSGTPNPCSSYIEESFCTNAGCKWGECNFDNDYKCCDSDDSCSSPSWYYIATGGCNNIPGLESCSGCNNNCGTYTTPSSCEGTSYCDWNDVGCLGTPSPCSSHTIQSACDMAGCTWNPVTTTPGGGGGGGGGCGRECMFETLGLLNILRRPLNTIITILSELSK